MIRAALKSLLGRKLRLLMSTFAIVLGVAFVAGSLMFSDTLNRSLTALFDATVGDVVVRPTGGQTVDGFISTQTVPADLVDELAALPDAARADGNVNADGVYVVDRDGKLVGGLGPPALGSNWTGAPAAGGLLGLAIVEGAAPRTGDEVVLDESTAERAGYEIGDEVPITTGTEQSDLAATLVGLAGFPEGGSLNGATLALFDTRTAQELFLDGQDAFTDVWVTAEPGVSQSELAAQAREVLPDEIEAVTGEKAADESASDLLEAVSFLTTFLLIFAGIALVVGSFLIVNTFSILVAQRGRELALFRALGASRRQVTWSVLLEAVVLGLVGATLGLGLGVLLAIGITAVVGSFGLDLSGQPLVLAPRTVLASYAVGIVVTTAAAWLPARRTGRIAPVQALRDDVALPETSLRRRFALGCALAAAGLAVLALGLFVDVPRAGWWIGAGVLAVLLGVSAASPVLSRPLLVAVRAVFARVAGAVGNLAGQNSLRNPRRTTATASALMIGLTLACTMAIIGASAKASVDAAIEESFVGDFVVSSALGAPFSPAVAERMAEVPGVQRVVRERFGAGLLDGERQSVAGTDPDEVGTLELDLVSGTPDDLADDTVFLQRSWAEEQGLEVGDTVELELPTGDRSWEVAGIFEDNPVVLAPILTTIDTLVAAGFQDRDNALILDVGGVAGDAAVVQDRLDEVVADQPAVTVKNQQEFAAEQREPIDNLVLTIFALLGLALVIAVLGIVNTLALSIIERTREIGLLRAIGLSRQQLRRMITMESVVIALLGAVLGLILGTGFGVALMYALRDEGLEVISIPVGQLAIFLGLSIVVGVLAAVLPARRAARLDVLRAIATE
ncbi:ABC transporter permease [Nocardioides pantholopis]|uniref:ABC transporter permease n=1 Tax=Nocardioides pantholopis TaxID=2483798 RepID=UPI000FDB5597|nr:FtsX-like permease family protein [Nocardioides pantholopis]